VGFFDLFANSKATPVVIIRNILGEQIDVVYARDLSGQDLRGRHWAHADLEGHWLDGANCEGIELFGARLVNTSFARCNLTNATLAYARVEGANFRQAELEGADLLYTDIKRARFDGATIGPTTTIPGIHACARREW
jgi:uncharacterized protein YjbI with pentapeptide repeats